MICFSRQLALGVVSCFQLGQEWLLPADLVSFLVASFLQEARPTQIQPRTTRKHRIYKVLKNVSCLLFFSLFLFTLLGLFHQALHGKLVVWQNSKRSDFVLISQVLNWSSLATREIRTDLHRTELILLNFRTGRFWALYWTIGLGRDCCACKRHV